MSVTGRASVLCVPAAKPEMVQKALASAASEVVVDLEDAVAPERKAVAREVVRQLQAPVGGPRVAVRINQLRSPWGLRDLEAVVDAAASIDSIVLPKTESRSDVAAVEQVIAGLAAAAGVPVRLGIQALVETAAGVAGLADIVSAPDRLESVIIGYADLGASLGRTAASDPATWRPVQVEVLVRARAANLDVIDGPHLSVADDDGFREATDAVAALGFDAKWVIHPRQIDHVNRAFTPSDEALAHARRVLEVLDAAHEGGSGALALDGELIDEAMAVAARRVIAKRKDIA